MSAPSRKSWLVVLLTILFVLWPRTGATHANGSARSPLRVSEQEARARLIEGFDRILGFFSQRDFSLVRAWGEMRESSEPDFFERTYPEIASELDEWARSLESRFGVAEAPGSRMDLTFLLEAFGPVAFDRSESDVERDNALAALCLICTMDELRCEPDLFYRFLATIVAEDESPARKAEALRWWRRSGGFIDEGLIENVLESDAGRDPELRVEAAKVLFTIGTRRSLQAQRLLISTRGLRPDPAGSQPQIACTAIRHFGRARFEPAVPDMLGALEDPSTEVRACAAESLAEITGRDPEFDPLGSGSSNSAAISQWRSWWDEREIPDNGSTR